jgi:phage gp16-like protein
MKAPDARNRELAAIHMGKKQLGLDDGTYRDMLWTVARVRSAAELDHAGRQAVIEHLRKRGFTKAEKASEAAAPAGKKPVVGADKQALVDKLERQLGSRPWNYVRAMAKRMFGVEQLEWASAGQLHSLVAALEYDAKRRQRKG